MQSPQIPEMKPGQEECRKADLRGRERLGLNRAKQLDVISAPKLAGGGVANRSQSSGKRIQKKT
jgi:hypothetical protein